MKKIVIATDNFLPRWDGISRFLVEVIPSIGKEFEVVVICPNYGKLKTEGFKVIQIPLSNWKVGDYVSAKWKRKKVRQEVKSSDIVFAQTIGPIGSMAIWYGSKYKKKVVSFVHSIEWELVPLAISHFSLKKMLYPFVKMYSRYLHNLCDLLILPSEETAESVSWSGLRSQKRIVNLGVDSEKFKPLKERSEKEQKIVEDLRKQFELDNCFVIGNHGRIAREKDLYTLLNAFKWLRKKHGDCKLVVIGDGIGEIAQRLASTNDVIVISAKDNVELYLNLFDVYVTTSLTETTSLTTLEAMSSGLAVASTPVGFIRSYIKDNYNGFLFNPQNSYMLFKILELMYSNPKLRLEVGGRARKNIIKKLSWDNTRKEITQILVETSSE